MISGESAIALKNAEQSGCGNNCIAKRAIDSKFGYVTKSVTSKEESWWKAELSEYTLITKIKIYFGRDNLKALQNFSVETTLSKDGPWRVCKGPYAVELPTDPHELQCHNVTRAKHVRLFTRGVKGYYALALEEVIVFGFKNGGENILFKRCYSISALKSP